MRHACGLLLVLLLVACQTLPAGEYRVPFRVLASGTHSAITQPREWVIRDSARWRQLWRMTGHHASPPPVDFDSQMVIALFMGEQPSGGYSIGIARITDTPQGLQVEVRLQRPAPDSMVSMALTQPWVIVRLPRHDGPVQFRYRWQ
jgi:hypothetical protein